jgi:DNA-binding CsgD family transcriptional regulator
LVTEWQNYRISIRLHWQLSLSIGLFFGWLLAFPLQGPILGSAAAVEGFNPFSSVVAFLIGHISGLLLAGVLGFRFPFLLRWFPLGALACLLLTVLAMWTPVADWLPLFALMGLLSAAVVISWGTAFTRSVPPHQRGHVVVTGIAAANICLYIMIQVSQSVLSDTLMLITMPLLLAAPAALIYKLRRTVPLLPKVAADPPVKLISYWPLLPFIFAVNVVGGLMYSIVSANWSAPGISPVYSVLPYIALVFVAGSIADNAGRRLIAFLGTGILGVGFMLYGISGGILLPLIVHTLVIGGFAFMDAFTWVVPADLATERRAPLYYGGILGINVLAVLTGMLLGNSFGKTIGETIVLTVSVAGLFLFASLAFIPKLGETLGRAPVPVEKPLRIVGLFERAGLTPRETEVAGLVIAGHSTELMQSKLYISADTLKTHLRNIYRKVGVRNRLELTHLILNGSARGDGLDSDS